jgi:hypothetical protein
VFIGSGGEEKLSTPQSEIELQTSSSYTVTLLTELILGIGYNIEIGNVFRYNRTSVTIFRAKLHKSCSQRIHVKLGHGPTHGHGWCFFNWLLQSLSDLGLP